MSSRSSSSSPDILGPPGDAEFLISSPTKPFSGRQSWASPANFSLLQTSAKRKRTSTSPSKGAHSIHFDDIVLPSSPSKKLNSPQAPKASSPTKGEPDENSSPWRIRVTVEASQDDENNGHGTSPSRKRFKPETTTMKVPLRDDKAILEQIPKRRKARPRKSSVGVAPHTGGPGSTPKPKVIGDSKMSTAQPRKMSPTLQVAKGKEEMRHTPSAEPEQRWSPLDLAADGDSDDGFPDAPTAVGGNGQKAEQAETNEPVGSSPVRESIEAGNDGLNTRSTNLAQNENDRNYDTNARPSPSRTPSPTLEEDYQLQENTLHAGHTPTARRIYPTPTSSSLLEEEQHERRQDTSVAFDGDFRRSERRARNDPTDEHREFDSIMESEGFSMVSLDTLPSSKQHRLASNQKPAQPSSKHPDEQNSKVYDSMGRRASTGDKYDKVVPISPARQQDPRLSRNLALPRSPSNSPDSLLDYGQDLNIKGTTAEIDPPLSIPSSVQFPATVATKSKPFPSLGRVVRVGMALQGTFRRQRRRSTLRSPSSSPESGDHGGGSQSARKRLERLFGDLNPDTQRELRVGLGIGQALAKRQKQVEIRRAKERTSKRAAATDNNKTGKALTEDSHVSYVEAKAPEKMRREGTEKGTFDSEIKRREVEWQREREANSRDIQMANSSQVIVVNSDAPSAEEGSDEDNRSGHEESDRGQERPESVSEVESEPESEQGSAEPIEPKSEPKPEFESEAEAQSDSGSESQAESRSGSKASPGSEQEISDEEGYEDIWQQEAKDLHSGDSTPQPRMRQRPSRQNIIPYTIPSDEAGTASPAYWVAGNEEVPFLGKSRVRQLREQEVDLSVWFRDRDTPDRFRYFYGNSTPQSIISNQSPVRRPVPGYSTATVSDEVGLHGASSQSGREVSSSPDRFSPVDNHILRHNAEDNGRSDLHRDQSAERDDGESVPDLPDHEAHEVYNRSSQSKSVSARNDGVINSRTPAWLKAPNFRHGGQSTATRPDVDEEWPEEEAEEMRLRSRRSIKVADIEGERRNALSPDHERTAVEDNDDNAISEEEEEKEDPVQYPHLSPLRDDHIHDTGIPRDERPTDSEPKRRRRPLSLSGYFTDNHYILLGHLYNLAKQDPELFPYHPTRGRANIIGDWIWTSDGKYGVPVTEGQFAIIDRFVQRLVHADLDYGGNGLMGWTDADLHRRLISIIIGEQIRANREAMMREDGLYGEEE